MRKLLAGLALLFAPAAWAQLAWNSQVYKDANCPPTGSSCTIGPSVICLPSGAMRLCADVNGDGTADTWVGDLDGEGTVGSADWNVDGTVEESGTKFAGAIVAQRFIAERAAGAYDSDGTTATVSSWTPTSTRVSNIAQAYAHAAMWGDPASYLAPAVFDQYLDVFLGHNIGTLSRNESTSNTVSQCWNSSCTSTYGILCVTDPASGTGADPDNDGTNEFAVNDVIVLGSQQKLRSHIITAINNGTGSGCPSGTANQWSVVPDVYSDEGHTAGVGVYNVWLNASHTTAEGGKFLGYKLGTAPRLRDGLQGPNLLRNGSADHDSTVENWTVSAGSISGNGFVSTPSTSQWVCWDGATSSCFYNLSGGSGATMDSSDWISVTPGERYVLSGTFLALSSDSVILLTDTNNDGTVEENSTFTIAWTAALDFKWPRWFWTTFTIPEGAHRVRIRFKKGGANSEPQIDGFSFRKVTTWETDDYTAKKVYLINDPGLRTIVYTGDSWAAPAAYGADIRTGLLAAFTDRFGRDLSSQVKATGVGGYYCKDLLNHWYDMVEKYEPLYLIISCGVNEVDGGVTTEADYILHQREIAQRARMIGAIPIFLSMPPFGDTVGASSKYEKAHTFRDAQRRAFLNEQPGGSAVGPQIAASGDVTDVGPACSGGACFTDGKTISTGTVFVFEGSTDDAYEFRMTVPGDPTADSQATFPAKNGTVVYSAASSQPTSQCATWDANGLLDGTGSACGGTGSSPGGSNTQFQFNDGGSFAGASGLTYNKTTNVSSAGTIDILKITNSDINGFLWRIGSGGFDNWKWGAYSFDVEGSSDDANETAVTFTNPTADRTITFPDASGTVQLQYGLLSSWHRENIAATGTVQMSPVDAATNTYLPIAPAATIVSLACTNSAVITAGTITFTVYNGTSATDVTVQQTTSTGSGAVLTDTTCTSNCSLSAGGRLRIDAAAAGTVAPTTTDPNCTVVISVP